MPTQQKRRELRSATNSGASPRELSKADSVLQLLQLKPGNPPSGLFVRSRNKPTKGGARDWHHPHHSSCPAPDRSPAPLGSQHQLGLRAVGPSRPDPRNRGRPAASGPPLGG